MINTQWHSFYLFFISYKQSTLENLQRLNHAFEMENAQEEAASDIIQTQGTTSPDQLVEDQRKILELLLRKFEPDSDIPQIAENLWNSSDDAWTGSAQASKAPRDKSLGIEFLNTLVPCGTSTTTPQDFDDGSTDSFGSGPKIWNSKSNLEIALEILEDWIQEPGRRYTSPWEEGLPMQSSDSQKSISTDPDPRISQVRDKWPQTWNWASDGDRWDVESYMKLNGCYGNKMEVYTAVPIPSNVKDPFDNELKLPLLQRRLKERKGIFASGIICQISLNRSSSIVDLNTMATILCLGKGTQFRSECTHDFLDAHVSDWRERSVNNRCGLRIFQSSQHAIAAKRYDPGSLEYGVFMHYMRSFTILDFEENSTIRGSPSSGLKCRREKITFKAFYTKKTQTLVERRYSTSLSLLPLQAPSGNYALLSLIDTGEEERRVWQNSPADGLSVYNRCKPWKKYGIHPAGLFTGVCVLQLQICSFIDSWRNDWNATITRVNEMVSVKLDVLNDDQSLKELVLETNPNDLVLYFKVLQMLGRFDDVIRTDTARLLSFSTNVRNPVVRDFWFQESYPHDKDTQRILEQNWEVVRQHQKQAADGLASQIRQTREEVRSLMDGLYNVQSVTEAQKSRRLNQYLMVFTIVTVVFLPPSFTATFFGMNSFQSTSAADTQKAFWTVLGILSGLTYVIAGIGLFGAKTSAEIKAGWNKMRDSRKGKATPDTKTIDQSFEKMNIQVPSYFRRDAGSGSTIQAESVV